MQIRPVTLGVAAAAGMIMATCNAAAADTISDYLRHGWQIRAAWGGPGEPYFLLQKANHYIVCNSELRDNPRLYDTVACSPVR